VNSFIIMFMELELIQLARENRIRWQPVSDAEIPSCNKEDWVEEFSLLGCNATYSDESQPTFWRNKLAPTFMLVSILAYSSALKLEATCSSKTLVGFHRNIRPYILEHCTLYKHRCENPKSHRIGTVLQAIVCSRNSDTLWYRDSLKQPRMQLNILLQVPVSTMKAGVEIALQSLYTFNRLYNVRA
jgi:hypothetical protein